MWGLPWDAYAHQYDRLFEMHDRSLWERRGPEYLERLQDLYVPIYMQRYQKDVPASKAYPLARTNALVGDYYGSSIAYMLALAILEKAERISIWGVQLDAASIFGHERPNLEYLIGFARGRGIAVDVAQPSALLTHRPENEFLDKAVAYPTRYGWLA